MKIRLIYLSSILLQCVILLPSCINHKQNNVKVSTDTVEIIYNKTEVDTAYSDTVTQNEAIRTITNFYKAYANDTSFTSGDSLREKYLTDNLIKKITRMTMSTGSDPILRSQDTGEDILKTLVVRNLRGNWYMVSYTWNKGAQFEKNVSIPLRVSKIKRQCQIDYITPEWDGTNYGDSLLCDHSKLQQVDSSNPLVFLETFFNLYTMKYGSMPQNLSVQLDTLRTEHLTSSALSQFNRAKKEQESDGWIGYDLLIDDFDLGCLQRSSIKIIRTDDDLYQMSYAKGDVLKIINIKVVKKGKQYYIDSISKNGK